MKESVELLKALTPFLVVFSVFVFLRKLWYYILKDVIKEKINEIQLINKKTLKVVSNELSERKKPDNSVSKISKEYFEDVRELFNEISNVAHYGSPGLATSAFLPCAMLNRMNDDDFNATTGEHAVAIAPLERDLKAFVANSLFLIESNAVRPVPLPNGIKVYTPKWINFDFKGAFGGGEIKYIDGLEQGPYLNPLGAPAAEFFFRVLRHHTQIHNHYLHKRYFQVLRSNIIFYTFFLEKEVYFPLELDIFPEEAFFGDIYASLISVGYNKGKDKYELMYANLSENLRLVNVYKDVGFKDKVTDYLGFPIERIAIYDDSEVFVLTINADNGRVDFFRKSFKMLREISGVLRKSYFLMCIHWLFAYFFRIIKRKLFFIFKCIFKYIKP